MRALIGMNMKIFIPVVCLLLLLSVPGCMDQQPENDDVYVTSFDTQNLAQQLDSYPRGTLTAAEEADILFMAEEEKLARDVYLALYEKWNARVFANIGDAEETHMSSIIVLIERYNLENPVQDTPGIFTNAELQALYTQLVQEGSSSLNEAFRVGALIEEIDIIDLQDAIGRTDKQDLIFVYENLMRGSRNHLRAFVRNLERQGETYEPQELSMEEYQEIISGSVEPGGFPVT